MTEYRDAYFPGTEELADDEMRLTALGTGMPFLRPSQASAAWLLELGNGDTFLFDLGTGSMMNFAALGIPYTEANKLFLTHLHVDHVGDFIPWYVGGWVERQADGGVEVWGPSGQEPHLGTESCINGLIDACAWDIESRQGKFPIEGLEIDIHEFDYAQEDQVVYDRNGVVVRSWPAIHALDGPVSYSLEWNGMKFVYGGDTAPNEWYIEYAKGADVAIHECFITVDLLERKFGFPHDQAVNVGTRVHTSPAAWASVMKEVQPRLAIAYHFFNDTGTAPVVYEEILDVYDGELTLAKDLMVWNITPEEIEVRHVYNTPDTWPKRPDDQKEGTRREATPMSDWLREGEVTFPGIDEYPDVPRM
jgi:ribonuclease Z